MHVMSIVVSTRLAKISFLFNRAYHLNGKMFKAKIEKRDVVYFAIQKIFQYIGILLML